MTSSGQISNLQGIKRNLYFWKAHDKSYPKIQFYLFWTSISNVMAIEIQFDHFLEWALAKYDHVT